MKTLTSSVVIRDSVITLVNMTHWKQIFLSPLFSRGYHDLYNYKLIKGF